MESVPKSTVELPPGALLIVYFLLRCVDVSYAPKTCDLKVSCSRCFTGEGEDAPWNIDDENVAVFLTSVTVFEGCSKATVSKFRDFEAKIFESW